MKPVWMVALFGAGIWLLFADSAPGAVPCNSCDCKSALYWRDFDASATYGLRGPDPADPKKTVPVSQAQKGWTEGKMYSSACDPGSISYTSNLYQRYQYNSAWTASCQVPTPPGGSARVDVTLTDPNDYGLAAGFAQEYQGVCQANGGGE